MKTSNNSALPAPPLSPLILGGNVFGWTASERESFDILDAFRDTGHTTIDTADVYSAWVPGHKGGESESIIGNWIHQRRNRDKVVIATKVGARSEDWSSGTLNAKYVVEAVERALRRLRTDYIDICQSHVDDVSCPLEETLEAYDELIRSGKIRTIGASHHSVGRLSEALQISKKNGLAEYSTYQVRYNLYDRNEYETSYQEYCQESGLRVFCYSALAKGFLTGHHSGDMGESASPWAETLRAYRTPKGKRILKALREVALNRTATMAEVAIAWLLSRPGVAAAIVAASDRSQLSEFIRAPTISLTTDELTLLECASTSIEDLPEAGV